ncbi:MAG: tRNA (adenosine(37)-N6)-threonylcarbamoyltransferase complex ATPase subunit type 1 TsaE [Flavobacteriales bacterium MED-G15]|nr:MAG: tRNA (adenosine(37)-N6)-threonylcarbamoyltransferase complex ATPase subunit type 1 TsaE [Flavobacteriales bacterium MED-G15]|tara:strand:+ start:1334 stop:1741 length:408 start_codon:yes stop_codon:yes gene_type:complete
MFFKYNLDQIGAAADFLDKNINNSIICFNGPMGVGKTTLISALCKKWQIKDVVSSPTFSIVNQYESECKGSFFHFDFYRLNSIEEALDIGVEEYLDAGNICLIEWGERIEGLLPEYFNTIEITIVENDFRSLKIV